MSYVLHFSGPAGFEQTVTIQPGGETVVIGRDPEAAVYLPDTERLVSRRHLSVEWSENGARIKVLSPNGINTDQGDYFQNDEVVLLEGESARIGSFSMIVAGVPEAVDLDATSFSGMGTRPVPTGPVTRSAPVPEAEKDPWADLMALSGAPAPAPSGPSAADQVAENAAHGDAFQLDDPFSSSESWSMGSGGSMPTGAGAAAVDPLAAFAQDASRPAPAPAGPSPEKFALQALCQGLGVSPPTVLTSFDWEGFGQSVRHVIQCLSDHLASRQETRKENRAEDRTMLGAKEVNPLKTDMALKDLVNYLLFMPQGAGGFVPANRALQEAAQEARWHEAAAKAGAKALAEGAVQEFEPGKLRTELLKGKVSLGLVDNARLWDLYTSHFEKKGATKGEWAGQLFNRYYMSGYLRETERLRRAAMPKPQERES